MLSILAPSLRRSLLARTLAVSLLPMVILAGASAQVADRIISERFEADSVARAQAVATRINDRVIAVSHAARMVAEIQPTRDALLANDESAGRRLLIPLKTRLGLDLLDLAGAEGRVVAAAEDTRNEVTIRPELTGPFVLRVEQSWLLDGETDKGLLLRAAAPVRQDGRLIGAVEAGLSLDAEFLKPLADPGGGPAGPSASLIGVFWRGRAQAVTSEALANLSVPTAEELRAGRIAHQVTTGGAPYFGVFSLVESHQATPAILAVLLPLGPVEAARQLLLAVLVVLLGALTIGVAVMAYWSGAMFTVPLLRLASAAQRLEEGEHQVPIPATSAHEIGQLERAFYRMSEALQAREKTLAALLSQLELRALSDELTGLPNRAALLERLEEALVASGAGSELALLLVDLDRFKEVNDTLGHQAGDVVLQQVALRFCDALSTSDTVARLGGDEFAVLLPATNFTGAVRVAHKLLAALEAPVQVLGRPLDIGASIGIATRLGSEDDGAALLRRADIAMYTAKRGRTGYACYAADQDEHTPDRLALMGELRRAILGNELVLHFQPKVSLQTGRIVHAEALVRWQHPLRGLVPPDQFIPLAEQTGLIAPLTEWVLNAALGQARVWRDCGQAIPVAVNVSVQNLHDTALATSVAERLDHHGVPAEDLIVEITETGVLVDPARATEVLRHLRALGVRVAIDDFGAGQSALGYLKQLPADELKIDRSFIRDLTRSPRDLAIVRAAIELGHGLGLSVVAEGVEDEATWDQLVSLGCDVAQGYFMSRPLTVPDLDMWMLSSPWGPATVGLSRAA